MSHVICHIYVVICFLDQLVELVGRGSVINWATPSSLKTFKVSFLPIVTAELIKSTKMYFFYKYFKFNENLILGMTVNYVYVHH